MIKLAHPIIEEDEKRAVIAALESGQLAQGPRVAVFEAAFAAHVGARHAVAVNSGTAALHVALLAHGIGGVAEPARAEGPRYEGDGRDEVIVPAFSFAATANVVLQAGARPVFVDIREEDFGIDVGAVAGAMTPRTRAVMAVHMYGQMCDVAALRTMCAERGVVLIEDAAQAVGASLGGENAGTFGTACFSFYATKNLQTGEGGMVTTADDAIAERLRMLRSQGERTRYVTEELGWNYRMTEVAAALGSVQLAKLEGRNERRRANAARLTELLAQVADTRAEGPRHESTPRAESGAIVTPCELSGRRHVWHQYTVRVTGGRERRDALQAHLRERGIETAVFYPAPIHRQPLYQRLGYGDVSMPVAERLAGEVLSLPVHPGLSDADVDWIAAAVVEATAT